MVRGCSSSVTVPPPSTLAVEPRCRGGLVDTEVPAGQESGQHSEQRYWVTQSTHGLWSETNEQYWKVTVNNKAMGPG